MRYAVRFLAGAVALALVGCGSGGDSAQEAQQYVSEIMRARYASLLRVTPWYHYLDEAMPNVKYKEAGKAPVEASQLVALGDIVDVSKGRGFVDEKPDGPGSREVGFDDNQIDWKTIHVSVNVKKRWASSENRKASKTVQFGLSFPASVDFDTVRAGLMEWKRVVVFLEEGGPIFAYDSSVKNILDGGAMFVSVDQDGNLDLPFEESHRAEEMLQGVETLSELEAKARGPEREYKLKREGGHAYREA